MKAAFKNCVDKCIKENQRKPNELSAEGGFLEIVGKLAIGFGEVSSELTALSVKINLKDVKRFV